MLVEPLSEEELNTAYSPILSPVVWDLGHIANFEELWLVRRGARSESPNGSLGRLYNAIENPRAGRNELPILRGDELRGYMALVREQALEALDGSTTADALSPEDRNRFEMVIAHEQQHSETILQLLQMIDGYEPPATDPGPAAEPVAPGPEMVEVPAGRHAIGAPPHGFAYDNERPRHEVELAAFLIDRTPVSNAAFAEFVADTGAEPPMYWQSDGEGSWVTTVFGRGDPIDPDLPVIHVDHGQARAFAAWAGKRLPTEFEWEAAAVGSDPDRANLDQLAFGPAPAGAFSDAPSEHGTVQMLGDIWEWTDSDLRGYEGFRPFPYPEYSEVFFGRGYKVLRGGAWATRRNVIRTSFRNWDLRQRRQIFAGIRCARDAW